MLRLAARLQHRLHQHDLGLADLQLEQLEVGSGQHQLLLRLLHFHSVA